MKKVIILVFVIGGGTFNTQAITWNKFWYGSGATVGAFAAISTAVQFGTEAEKIRFQCWLNPIFAALNPIYQSHTGSSRELFDQFKIDTKSIANFAVITILYAYLTKLMYDKCWEEDIKEKTLVKFQQDPMFDAAVEREVQKRLSEQK